MKNQRELRIDEDTSESDHIVITPGQHRKPEKMRLTDRFIRTIEPAAQTQWVYDSEVPYLGLRTMPSGVKSFTYGYRNHEGRLHRVTLGRFPALTATAARIRAREIAAKVAAGKDPYEEKHARRAKLTTAKLVDLFAQSYLPAKKRGHEWEAYLRRDFVPHVGAHTKAEDVKRRDIVVMLNAKAASAPVAANRLLEVVRRLYSWGLEQDLVETTPCVNVKRPGVERSRDRVLSEEEIGTFWERLATASRISEGVRVALKLILVLGQRPGEIVNMEWTDLDLDGGWWELPRDKTKSDRAHRLPLTQFALGILADRPRGDPWVFPSVQGKPLRVLALSHAVRHNREHFGIEPFRPHDLRRTQASNLAALDVDRFLIERILNHADHSIGGVYDRFQYGPQMRRALDKWERKLQAIIGEPVESKVVEIGR